MSHRIPRDERARHDHRHGARDKDREYQRPEQYHGHSGSDLPTLRPSRAWRPQRGTISGYSAYAAGGCWTIRVDRAFFPPSRAEAAIDVQHGAGDVGSPGAGEEYDSGGNFFGTAVAAERDARLLGLGEGAFIRIHVRADGSRLDDVHGDLARSEVAGGTLAVTDDRGLGRGIVGEAWKRGAGGENGSDRNDPPAFPHELRRGADGDHHGGVIDGELAVERGDVGGRIVNRAVGRNAGVVDENIKVCEVGGDSLDQIFNLGGN